MAEKKMTPKQIAAIAALMAGQNVRAAAKAAGTSERSLYRWLENADFKAALSEAKAAALGTAVRHLATISGEAVTVLHEVMKSTANDSVRVRAALGALEAAIKLSEVEDFERRITELEAIINTGKRPDG